MEQLSSEMQKTQYQTVSNNPEFSTTFAGTITNSTINNPGCTVVTPLLKNDTFGATTISSNFIVTGTTITKGSLLINNTNTSGSTLIDVIQPGLLASGGNFVTMQLGRENSLNNSGIFRYDYVTTASASNNFTVKLLDAVAQTVTNGSGTTITGPVFGSSNLQINPKILYPIYRFIDTDTSDVFRWTTTSNISRIVISISNLSVFGAYSGGDVYIQFLKGATIYNNNPGNYKGVTVLRGSNNIYWPGQGIQLNTQSYFPTGEGWGQLTFQGQIVLTHMGSAPHQVWTILGSLSTSDSTFSGSTTYGPYTFGYIGHFIAGAGFSPIDGIRITTNTSLRKINTCNVTITTQ